MKKQYIKPQAETLFFEAQALMRPSGHDNNMPEAKEDQLFEEEDALDHIKNLEFPHIWEDEEE
ncbi:MAG: hypothetical protein J5953_00050 [Prevotella sp.]|nr:hypothetical protein [Prevotella sp.]